MRANLHETKLCLDCRTGTYGRASRPKISKDFPPKCDVPRLDRVHRRGSWWKRWEEKTGVEVTEDLKTGKVKP